VTSQTVRAEIERRLGTGSARPSGSLGMAPQTKRLLELARAIAKSLGHRCPRTEHVVLAATSPRLRGPAAELLSDCGADRAQIRDQLTRILLKEAPEMASRMRFLGRIRMRRSL